MFGVKSFILLVLSVFTAFSVFCHILFCFVLYIKMLLLFTFSISVFRF